MPIKAFYRGDTKSYRVQITTKITNTTVSLVGKVLWFTLKVDPDDSDEDAVFQTSVTFPDTENSRAGIGYLTLTSEQTTLIPPGDYWYDFQLVSPVTGSPSFVVTLDSDRVEVLKDVTRRIT